MPPHPAGLNTYLRSKHVFKVQWLARDTVLEGERERERETNHTVLAE
jgi:hypothetical protein